MNKKRTKWILSENVTRVIDPKECYGLMTLRDVCRVTGVPISTLITYVQRGLIHPLLLSERKKKRLFSPAVVLTIAKIKKMRRQGIRPSKLERLANDCTAHESVK